MNYLQAAANFPSQPLDKFDHQYLRYGLILPIRLAINVFGYSQAAYYAVPVLSCAVLVLSTYVLGVIWFGRVVGALGALLMFGNSAVFNLLSLPSPDLTATALFMAAIVVAALLARPRSRLAATAFRRAAALAVIGLLLAASYLCREFIVALWPLVAVLLFRRIRWRECGWLAAPVIVLFAAETWINAVVVGDPLARFHAAAEHGSGVVPAEFAPTYLNKPAWVYLIRLPTVFYVLPEGRWLLPLLALALAGGALAVASRRGPLRSTALGRDPRMARLGLLTLWIVLLWVPLTLLGGLLDPAHPTLRLQLPRYWFPVFPAIFLGGVAVARLLGAAAARRTAALRRRPGAAAVVAALAAAVVAIPPLVVAANDHADDPRYRANGASQLEEFRTWLAGRSDVRVIWADRRTARILPLFTTGVSGGTVWDGEIRAIPRRGPVPALSDHEVVVLYSTGSDRPICGRCRQEAQALLGDPITLPPAWIHLYQTPDGVVQVYRG